MNIPLNDNVLRLLELEAAIEKIKSGELQETSSDQDAVILKSLRFEADNILIGLKVLTGIK